MHFVEYIKYSIEMEHIYNLKLWNSFPDFLLQKLGGKLAISCKLSTPAR